MKAPILLNKAQDLAMRIAAELAPFCENVAVAGSIRRRRDWCNDIDLVCLPKPGQLIPLQERFHQRCKVVSEGVQNAMYELANGVQLDVFFAHREARDIFGEVQARANFGTLLLCRTGSAAHNIYLVEWAKRRDLFWKPYEGVFAQEDGRCLASETEEGIFKALGLEFVPPEKRER